MPKDVTRILNTARETAKQRDARVVVHLYVRTGLTPTVVNLELGVCDAIDECIHSLLLNEDDVLKFAVTFMNIVETTQGLGSGAADVRIVYPRNHTEKDSLEIGRQAANTLGLSNFTAKVKNPQEMQA